MVLIENWVLLYPEFSPYTAPECIMVEIHGNVFNDDRFPDGHFCQIFQDRFVAFDGDCKVMSISGNVYRFGAPRESYERTMPNARARLMENFRKNLKIQKF